MCKLIVLVGLPFSGKTSWGREFITKTPASALVGLDAVRLSFHGQRSHEHPRWPLTAPALEPWVETMALGMIRALFEAGHRDVVLDACNLFRGERRRWTRGAFWETEYKVMETPASVCARRAAQAGYGKRMPLNRLREYFRNMDQLGEDEQPFGRC